MYIVYYTYTHSIDNWYTVIIVLYQYVHSFIIIILTFNLSVKYREHNY